MSLLANKTKRYFCVTICVILMRNYKTTIPKRIPWSKGWFIGKLINEQCKMYGTEMRISRSALKLYADADLTYILEAFYEFRFLITSTFSKSEWCSCVCVCVNYTIRSIHSKINKKIFTGTLSWSYTHEIHSLACCCYCYCCKPWIYVFIRCNTIDSMHICWPENWLSA